MKLSKKGEKRKVNVFPMDEGVLVIEGEFGGSETVRVFLTREEVRNLADYVQSLPALEE